MAVYFVYRSHYDDPSGKRMKRFDDATVLDWFRNHWVELTQGDSSARVKGLLGFHVYGFASLFGSAADEGLAPPKSNTQLTEYLNEHLYSEGPILFKPHLLTVKTDDDELEVCYYVFDDAYLARRAARAAYLLHEGWRFPAEHAESGTFTPSEPTDVCKPAGKGAGTTYLVYNAFQDSGNLSDLTPAHRIEGIRIPELARYLCEQDRLKDHSDYLMLVRSQLLSAPITSDPFEEGFRQALLANAGDDASWSAYSDWLQDQGRPAAGLCLLEQALGAVAHHGVEDMTHLANNIFRTGTIQRVREAVTRGLAKKRHEPRERHDPTKSHVQVEEHLAQLCVHVSRWDDKDLYHQWIFFDDLWAAAHPDLANALLRYARCWDVLTPDGPHDDEDE